jgi:hypothetical protein
MENETPVPPPEESPLAQELRRRRPPGPDWLPTWELAALVVGDLLACIVFAAIGRASHNMGDQGGLIAALNTAVPFLLAWLIVGMVLGLYRGTALYPLGRVVWKSLLNGLIAGPLGVAFRAIWLGHPVIWTFVLVGTLSSALILTLWRVGWSRLRRLWWPELP